MINRKKAVLAGMLVAIGAALSPLLKAPAPKANARCNVNPHTGVPDNAYRHLYEAYACINNAEACDDSARDGLLKVNPRWGPFDFFCFEGHVSQIHTSTGSAIERDHMGFIRENHALFGLRSNPAFQLIQPDAGEQIYKGLRVAAGVRSGEHKNGGQSGDENWFSLNVHLRDSSDWTFDTKPLITESAAIKTAIQYWEPHRPPEISEWRTEAKYWIRSNPPEDSDCPKEPGGAWVINGSGHWNPKRGGNTHLRQMVAMVDGKTGIACSYSGDGSAEYRLRKKRGV